MLQLQLKQSEAIPIELEEEARRKLLALDIEKQHLEETTIGLRTLMADVEKTWHQRYCQIGAAQQRNTSGVDQETSTDAVPELVAPAIDLQMEHTVAKLIEKVAAAEQQSTKAQGREAKVVRRLEQQEQENERLVKARENALAALRQEQERGAQLLKGQQEEATRQASQLQAQLATASQRTHTDASVIQDLRNTVRELKASLADTTANLAAATAVAATREGKGQTALQEMMDSRDAVAAQVEKMKTNLAEQDLLHQRRTQADSATICELRAQLENLQTQQQAAHSERVQALDRVAELQSNNTQLQKALATATANAESAREEMLKATRDQVVAVSSSKTASEVFGTQMEDMQLTVSQLSVLMDSGNENVQELHDHVASLQHAVLGYRTATHEEQNSLAAQIETLEARVGAISERDGSGGGGSSSSRSTTRRNSSYCLTPGQNHAGRSEVVAPQVTSPRQLPVTLRNSSAQETLITPTPTARGSGGDGSDAGMAVASSNKHARTKKSTVVSKQQATMRAALQQLRVELHNFNGSQTAKLSSGLGGRLGSKDNLGNLGGSLGSSSLGGKENARMGVPPKNLRRYFPPSPQKLSTQHTSTAAVPMLGMR